MRSFPAGTVLMAGREAMRERYTRLFADHPDLHCDLVHRVEHERFVIDHEHVTGMKDDEVVHAVALYEVEDGLIKNVWFLREE